MSQRTLDTNYCGQWKSWELTAHCKTDLSHDCFGLLHTGLVQGDGSISIKQVPPVPREITPCPVCGLVGDMDVPKLLWHMRLDLPVAPNGSDGLIWHWFCINQASVEIF
jgi:hypothetical protein